MQGLILKVDCPDQHGIVAKIASYVADYSGNLVEFSQFTDDDHAKFFARVEIDTSDLNILWAVTERLIYRYREPVSIDLRDTCI